MASESGILMASIFLPFTRSINLFLGKEEEQVLLPGLPFAILVVCTIY